MELSTILNKKFKLKDTILESLKKNSLDFIYSMLLALFIIYICTRFDRHFFFFDDAQNLILPYLKQSGELWLKGEIPFLLNKEILGQNNILEVDRGIFLPQNILLSIIASKVHSFNSLARISAFINLTLFSFFSQKISDALKMNNVFKRTMAFLFCINPMILYIYLPSWWALITGQVWFVALFASILFLRDRFSVKNMVFYIVSVISIFLNSFPNHVIVYLIIVLSFMLELFKDKKYKQLLCFVVISFFIALIVINVYSEFIISASLLSRDRSFNNIGNFNVPSLSFIIMSFTPLYFDFINTYGGYRILYFSFGYSSIYILFLIFLKKSFKELLKNKTTKFLLILIVIFFILTQMPTTFSFLHQPWRFLQFLSELIIIFSMYTLNINKLKINKNRLTIFIVIILISFILSIFRLEEINLKIIAINFVFVISSIMYVYFVYRNKEIRMSSTMIYSVLMLILMLFSKGSVDGFLPLPGVNDRIDMRNDFANKGYILSLTNGQETKNNIEDLHSSQFLLYDLKAINGYSPLGNKKLQETLIISAAQAWFDPEKTVNNLSNKYNNICYFDLFNITSIPIWKVNLTPEMQNKIQNCGYISKEVNNPDVIYFIKNKNILGNISYVSEGINIDKLILQKNNKEIYKITTTSNKGEIILSKPYWRGYTAKINGKKVGISDELGLLRLDNIPSNVKNGTLEIRYFPRSWRVTLWLGLIGVIGIVLTLRYIKKHELIFENKIKKG